MNLIKISGKIIQKEKNNKDNRTLKIVIAIPLRMKSFDEDGNVKQCYSYFSCSLIGLDKEQYTNLRKGNYVEITGYICGNCKDDGTIISDTTIFPKSITKGGR